MHSSSLRQIVRCELRAGSSIRHYLQLNKRVWDRLPPVLIASRPVRTYGAILNTLVRLGAVRQFNFGTFFFRNRPQLELIRRLATKKPAGAILKLTVLACSKGAEVYSILWTIRVARPDLHVVMHAVDVSQDVLEFAREATYSLSAHEFANVPVFGRICESELREMFDTEGDRARVKDWLKEGIVWHLADAADPKILHALGPQDLVVGNNFLCHMDPSPAEDCLRNVARLVSPGGHLFVSGVDLDIRTKVARDQGWSPLVDLIEEIHDGDPCLRVDWPWQYWGLEPLNKNRRDWKVRYASGFRIGRDV